MKIVLVALSLLCCAACEKKPTEEEILQKQQDAERMKATPKPKPGDWMWKDRHNPLEQKRP